MSASRTTRPASKLRQRAYRFGLLAEWLCAALLLGKGYRILHWRYRNRGGEVDIIARRGKVLVFAEVKARREVAASLSAAGEEKWRTLSRAAEIYLQNHPMHDGILRFDFLYVTPWLVPRHLPDIWRYNP
jgi:putative endonuclease